jgi:hypothetical protein
MFEKTDNIQKKYNNNEPDAKLMLSIRRRINNEIKLAHQLQES